ncbi:MAG: tetratricopeptide repeat protein [Candidatus Cyclobacteriaceae bacterium M2_1C_046]
MKAKIVVLLVAVVLVVLMFQLPRVVVDNDRELEPQTASLEPQGNTPHSTLTDPAVVNQVDSVKRLWNFDNYSEKNASFASYLANQYLALSQYDSAIRYFEWLLEHFPQEETQLKTAEAYYQAFGFAMQPETRKKYAERARALYQDLLEENPDDLAIKNKLAMTYMASNNPMQGIGMLREIVALDPENADALLNLGILAIQTSQYGRAEEHLSQLIKYHPEHYQGHLLLGAAKLEHGHREEAKQHFEIVKEKGDDPALVEAAENYLRDI